jgi:hypothetical protein
MNLGGNGNQSVEKILIFLNSGQGINYQEIQFDLGKKLFTLLGIQFPHTSSILDLMDQLR